MDCEVVGKRPRGRQGDRRRPEKFSGERLVKLSQGDAIDRERWREGVRGCKWPTPAYAGNVAIKTRACVCNCDERKLERVRGP